MIRADIRLIAATNADLKAKIAREEFREDFYFRLSVLPIHVPPLRDRPEDIPLLAEYFIQKYKHQSGRRDYRLEADDLALLKAHTWPGNVRELENLIERGLVMGTQVGTILGTKPLTQAASAPSSGVGENAGDMIARLIAEGRIPERRRRAGGSGKPPASNWQPSTIGELEKAHILQTLRYTEGRRTQAARLLGINPATLWRKMKQYAIDESTEEGSTKDESAE